MIHRSTKCKTSDSGIFPVESDEVEDDEDEESSLSESELLELEELEDVVLLVSVDFYNMCPTITKSLQLYSHRVSIRF